MVEKVALNGSWSQASSWQDGVVPTGGSSLSVTIAPGVTSTADVGLHGANQPFVVGSLSFERGSAEASTLAVDVTPGNAFAPDAPFLQVQNLFGGAPRNQNQVSVGAHIAFPSGGIPHETAALQITGDAINTHFILTGGTSYHDIGGGEVDIGHRSNGSSFTFDGNGFQDTLLLEHPPLGFIYNDIHVAAFPAPGPLGGGSGVERIELGGVHFDAVDFIPYRFQNAGATAETGAVVLMDQNRPVYALLNVHATGYGGSANGHFSVGVDAQTHLDYVQYSR